MLVVMRKGANQAEVDRVCGSIKEMGLMAHPIPGAQRVAIGITGNKEMVDTNRIIGLPGVIEIIHVTRPYKLASREMKPDDTVIEINGFRIGGVHICVIAGPCAVESHEQMMKTALSVKAMGATMLRGGAFKPRTSPYAFQGLGEEGLRIMAGTKRKRLVCRSYPK